LNLGVLSAPTRLAPQPEGEPYAFKALLRSVNGDVRLRAETTLPIKWIAAQMQISTAKGCLRPG